MTVDDGELKGLKAECASLSLNVGKRGVRGEPWLYTIYKFTVLEAMLPSLRWSRHARSVPKVIRIPVLEKSVFDANSF